MAVSYAGAEAGRVKSALRRREALTHDTSAAPARWRRDQVRTSDAGADDFTSFMAGLIQAYPRRPDQEGAVPV